MKWFPTLNSIPSNLTRNSWFDFKIYKNKKLKKKKQRINTNILLTKKLRIYPTNTQHKILQKWFNNVIDVYNITNDYIKKKFFVGDKFNIKHKKDINFIKIRNLLKNKINDNKIDGCNKHTLDYSVKICIEMYKSAISNKINGNINNFNIKNLKYNRRRKNLVIEPNNFSKKINGFFVKKLKEMKTDIELKNITKNTILQYDSHTKKYVLLVPYTFNNKKKVKRNRKCGIDIGVRTFITAYTRNEVYEIGTNLRPKMILYFKRKDKIKSDLDNKIINDNLYTKLRNKIEDKMKNRINDLHKKVANYLVKNNETINIGNVSTKSMVSNLTGNMYKIVKRRLHVLQHYRFRMYLLLIAKKWNCKVKEINEYKTSIRCFNCKNENKNLGKSKVYNCSKCRIILDRDVNASINIRRM